MLKLGETYSDVITGFVGIATVRYDQMHGPIVVKLTKKGVNDDGKCVDHQTPLSQLRDENGDTVTADEVVPQIAFGTLCYDEITGFKGKLTEVAHHIDGCVQYALVPKVNDKGEVNTGYMFDDTRIVAVETEQRVAVPAGKGPADIKPSRSVENAR